MDQRAIVFLAAAAIFILGRASMVLAAPEVISAKLPLSIRTTDGHSYEANRIRLGWNDLVQIVDLSGRATDMAATKIAKVQDGEGNDLTRLVLDGHEVIGTEGKAIPVDSLRAVTVSEFIDRQSRPRRPLSGFIAQGAYMKRVGESKEYTDIGRLNHKEVSRPIVQTELGGISRVSDSWGAGATFLIGGNDDFTLFGIKARFRRMLGTKTFIDLAPGFIAETPTNGSYSTTNAVVGEVTVLADGWVGATTQFQIADRPDATGRKSREWWWYIGPKIGGKPGIAAGAVAFLILLGSQIPST